MTASEILAKRQGAETEFLNNFLEEKLKYVTTGPYWNEPQAKLKLYRISSRPELRINRTAVRPRWNALVGASPESETHPRMGARRATDGRCPASRIRIKRDTAQRDVGPSSFSRPLRGR